MKTVNMELFTPPGNNAIVRLPGRKYPGIVLQGDSLHVLFGLICEIRKKTEDLGGRDLLDSVDDLHQQVQQMLDFYEHVCRENGIAIPYVRQENGR